MSVALGNMLERRTVDWLRDLGYHAERVSRRGRFGTSDLFGCVDIVALNDEGISLIQVTTKEGASARRKKIRDANLPYPVRLIAWRKANNRWNFLSEVIMPNDT
jgi:Holliday junction resolvase